MKSAIVELASGKVLNVITADPSTDPAPDNTNLVRIGFAPVDVGWTYAAGAFTKTLSARDIAAAIAAEDAAILNVEG